MHSLSSLTTPFIYSYNIHCLSAACTSPVSLCLSSQGEVAFSSRSGACLCGRPSQCGAAATAADATVSPIRVDAGGDASKHPKAPRSIQQEHSYGTSTIKAPAIHINVGVFIWKEESGVALTAAWLAWQQGCRWSDSARTVHICLEGERGERKPAFWSPHRSG